MRGSYPTEPSRSCYACRSSSACRFTVPVCRRRGRRANPLCPVGTYNPNGEGLYRFTVDAKTGALRDKTLVSSLPNVAQLTVSRDGKTLYAASEVEKAWCRRGALKRTAS
nr:Lactonase, 7-bladed beta-propeller [Klebsiella pneumoniae]